MDKQTQEIIEGVVAITIEYGVDIVGAIVLLIIGWTVAGWARRGVRHALERVPRMDETLKPFLAKLVWYVIMAFVLVAVLSQFGVQTTSVIAVLGAAGLAIGLALQGTLANVASGVMLLFLRPFNIGDYVDAGGIAGTVVEIGLFNTEIKTRNGLCLIVPNKII
ncbi:MAG TPA: mechanosensitive ion channel [Rhodospirillales bacterium]|jgi:small conductance mechanosensitive channel|nr:mechanosensitive ion channel [Rhodospirillales bacterium]